MKIPVIKIGNSKGIRISKMILDKYKIRDAVDLVFEEEQIIIRPITHVRTGWEEAFKEMHDRGDDALLIEDVFTDENQEE